MTCPTPIVDTGYDSPTPSNPVNTRVCPRHIRQTRRDRQRARHRRAQRVHDPQFPVPIVRRDLTLDFAMTGPPVDHTRK